MRLVYLAVPYTHAEMEVQEARFHAVNKCAADMMRRGIHVFSPISHTHPIATDSDFPLPADWEYWNEYDFAMLKCCSKIAILQLEGWEISKGVTAEIALAKQLGIPIEYIPAGDYQVNL